MHNSLSGFFSRAAKNMELSAIREMLKLTQKSDMISFAGGLPAPETFPVSDLEEITKEVLEKEGTSALQYGTTEGDSLLRKLLVERSNRMGLKIKIDNLIITSGSQQALDLICKIFIDPGDYIICGLPTYHGAINLFKVYGACMEGVPLDDNGIMDNRLEKAIISLQHQGKIVKLIYLIPDFQNPAGVTLSEERRIRIIEFAEKYNLLIIEDSPYRDLRFEGKQHRMMYELDSNGRVITLNTFSKIFSPGFRLGWVTGNPEILEQIVMAKQSADLCSPSFVQKILARYIEKGLLDKNLQKTINLYRERRDFMLECFRKYMPEDVKWTEPEGGLFLFMTLPKSINAADILIKSIEKKVAFVCGSIFYCNNTGHNTIRINFSYSCKADIEKGVIRLASVIKEAL